MIDKMRGLSGWVHKLLIEARPEIVGGLVVAAVLALISALGLTIKAIWRYPRFFPWALTGIIFLLTAFGVIYHLRLRRYALGVLLVILLLAESGVGYYFYQKAQPPNQPISTPSPSQVAAIPSPSAAILTPPPSQVISTLPSREVIIILVANFDEPEPKKYRVTDTLLKRLRDAAKPYQDVEIKPLGRIITEAEGSDRARAEGERQKATIVIWGWYGATETLPLSVHFELLRPPPYMPELGAEVRGQVQMAAMAQLESFALQTRLSAEIAYLSLFTVGMARYAAEDWDGAVICFSDALSQTAERVSTLDQSIVYFCRGNAYYRKGDYDRAIADYTRAIQLKPNDAEAYYNRGNAYADKGDYDRAIADYERAIQLKPDLAEAYYNRGIAYKMRGEKEKAIADFKRFLELSKDPYWRQQAEEQLKALEGR